MFFKTSQFRHRTESLEILYLSYKSAHELIFMSHASVYTEPKLPTLLKRTLKESRWTLIIWKNSKMIYLPLNKSSHDLLS